MKLIILVATIGMLGFSNSSHAHTKVLKHKSNVSVTVGWTWISAHISHGKYVKAHWRHPVHGKSYRSHIAGPPARKSHAHSRWIPGHYERRGKNMIWIHGRWSR